MTSLKHVLNYDLEDQKDDESERSLKRPYFGKDSPEESTLPTLPIWQATNKLSRGQGLEGENCVTNGRVRNFEDANLHGNSHGSLSTSRNLSTTSDVDSPPSISVTGGLEDTSISTDNGTVCFGMIYEAKVKAVGEMAKIDSKLNTPNVNAIAKHFLFDIKKEDDKYNLVFRDGTGMADTNMQLVRAFNELSKHSHVRLEALVLSSTLRETIARAVKEQDAIFPVNINVYGNDDEKEYVGKVLSKHKLFLQRPDWKQPSISYHNPHIYHVPGMDNDEMLLNLYSERNDTQLLDNTNNLEDVLEDVYTSLKRSNHLKLLDADARIKTSLLPHQRTGLDFMVQRESGPIPEEFQLWTTKTINDRSWYAHKVADVMSRSLPVETGGGILADKMGMGKSLSILALITRTLEEAQSWSRNPNAFLETGISSDKKLTRATLIVVPSALLINGWMNEINIHLNGELNVVAYHGLKRQQQALKIYDADVVLTTFHTLAAEHEKETNPISQIAWFRIVLDEAHVIRRHTTKLHRCVAELTAKHRWCLTGTPIQNHLDDVGALFAFLRIRPFENLGTFRKCISAPFDSRNQYTSNALRDLRVLLDSLCLRRTEEELEIPECEERTHMIELTHAERKLYMETQKTMNRALRQQAGLSGHESRFGMFQAQLQLRILCNHGTFQHHFSWARKRNILEDRDARESELSSRQEMNCSSCRQPMPITSRNLQSGFNKSCGHILCYECLGQATDVCDKGDDTATSCLLCTRSGQDSNQKSLVADYWRDYFRQNGHSSKITRLLQDLQQDLASSKSIIFSCWTTTLELISLHLRRLSISFVRVDGDCPLNERQKRLDAFSSDDRLRVLIMTTGTGAFGLNLTAANRVFLVEPQWNPSIESQAVARAIRLGQGQRVTVTKYLTKDTVEQQMQSQQNRKLWMAKMAGSSKARDTTSELAAINASIDQDNSLFLND